MSGADFVHHGNNLSDNSMYHSKRAEEASELVNSSRAAR